ncbi:MAG TPA: hypothetical protein VGC91_16380 [Pyrinomonadaceae bacterium]|jgi:hypothetical protein
MTVQRRRASRLSFRLTTILFACAATLLATACGDEVKKATVGSKSAANEGAAIGALRTVASAESTYSASHDGDYGTLAQLVESGQLDARFGGSSPIVGGYVLTMRVSPQDTAGGRPASYAVNADPQQNVAEASTGNRHFCLDSSDGAIHVNAKQTASASDPPL